MLQIGICDDDVAVRQEIYELTSKILFKYTEMSFFYYKDGQEVIEALERGTFQVELLLLDIHMPGQNGIDTADYIRKNKVDVDIIFVTASPEYVFEGYKYRAFAYCIKPVASSQLGDILIRYIKEKQNSSYCMTVSVNGRDEKIFLNRVLFFESQKRRIIVHTLDENVVFYGKMNELEQILPKEQFFRCHQSYIVNQTWVDSIRRTEVIIDGISIPMSRRYYELMSKTEVESTKSMMITKSLAMNSEEKGAVIFTSGKLAGTIIRLNDGQKITLGRDATKAEVVIEVETVSRVHCTIQYNGILNNYSVCDFSKNGVFFGNGKRLEQRSEVQLEPGSELWIGDKINRIRLG